MQDRKNLFLDHLYSFRNRNRLGIGFLTVHNWIFEKKKNCAKGKKKVFPK